MRHLKFLGLGLLVLTSVCIGIGLFIFGVILMLSYPWLTLPPIVLAFSYGLGYNIYNGRD